MNSEEKLLKKMIDSHWSYVKKVIEIEIESNIFEISKEKYLETIEFHYKTAMAHGYKHAKEEIK